MRKDRAWAEDVVAANTPTTRTPARNHSRYLIRGTPFRIPRFPRGAALIAGDDNPNTMFGNPVRKCSHQQDSDQARTVFESALEAAMMSVTVKDSATARVFSEKKFLGNLPSPGFRKLAARTLKSLRNHQGKYLISLGICRSGGRTRPYASVPKNPRDSPAKTSSSYGRVSFRRRVGRGSRTAGSQNTRGSKRRGFAEHPLRHRSTRSGVDRSFSRSSNSYHGKEDVLCWPSF